MGPVWNPRGSYWMPMKMLTLLTYKVALVSRCLLSLDSSTSYIVVPRYEVTDTWCQVPDLMYKQVKSPRFVVCARIVELVLLLILPILSSSVARSEVFGTPAPSTHADVDACGRGGSKWTSTQKIKAH